MLFGMVERGTGLNFAGDKGKANAAFDLKLGLSGQDAMWAVILTKELWQKSIWSAPSMLPASHPNLSKGMMQNPSQ